MDLYLASEGATKVDDFWQTDYRNLAVFRGEVQFLPLSKMVMETRIDGCIKFSVSEIENLLSKSKMNRWLPNIKCSSSAN